MRVCLAALVTWGCTACAVFAAAAAEPAAVERVTDTRLKAATEQVLRSDRYLHQSKITRGMTGYGLTVMAGTEIVRFDVEIVSVLVGYGPQRDMILARVSGQGLETSGIIQGMSGSPVYLHHEGSDKLIGALAYGWAFQKSFGRGPLCGIQPIAQMLAMAEPRSIVGRTAMKEPTSGRLSPQWRRAALAPAKKDFTRFARPTSLKTAQAADAGRMRPLGTPIMVGGVSDRTFSALTGGLEGLNVTAVRCGAAANAAAAELAGLALTPGSSLVVPMVRGDMDLSGVGTVTEVVGDRVFGFGHPMFSEGLIHYPMAVGYVHTVMASMQMSFKMAGAGPVVGELNSDEASGVAGVVGPEVDMIPVSFDVSWDGAAQRQRYAYEILRQRQMTTLLAMTAAAESVWGTRETPAEHTVDYDVTIDFGELGRYRVSNLSAGRNIYDMVSDLTRPISLMLNNPFGVARIRSIDCRVRIRDGARRADVLGVQLDRTAYAPGETVNARVDLRRYKGPRLSRTIRLTLPADLPEGQYKLSCGDWMMALDSLQARRPRLFDPRNLRQLLAAAQRAAEPRMDRLYAVLETGRAGVSVDTDVIAEAPGAVEAILQAARPLDVSPVGRAVTAECDMNEYICGDAETIIIVRKHPRRP